MGRCNASASAAEDSPTVVLAKEKGMKRQDAELEAEEVAHEVRAFDKESSSETAKKGRVPQEMIDLILSWDVFDYVFATPDNMDDMPISEESKARYREGRKEAVALMRKRRGIKRQMQEWVRAELAKNGGVIVVETTAEMLAEHDLEEYIAGQTA